MQYETFSTKCSLWEEESGKRITELLRQGIFPSVPQFLALPLFGAVVGVRRRKWHSGVLHMKISEQQRNLVLWKTLKARIVLIVLMDCKSGKKQ